MFLDDSCCVRFLSLVEETVQRFGVEVQGYALMPNHFHLMVRTPRANLGVAMRHLLSRYGHWLNKSHGWDGSVFRGRYKNRVVENLGYWRYLLAYIHLNPVRAGLVVHPDQANWTSHAAYAGREGVPGWLSVAEMLGHFGGVESLERYVRDVHRGSEFPPQGFDPADLFVRQRRADLDLAGLGERPRSPVFRSREEALADVCAVTGESRESLFVGRAGRTGNPARWIAMWWLAKGAGLSGSEIARFLDADPSQVSRTLRRVASAGEEDPRILRWVAELTGARSAAAAKVGKDQ